MTLSKSQLHARVPEAEKLYVYSDGSSAGHAGKPGGWGYVLLRNGTVLQEGSGGDPITSNNRMELRGAIEGLKAAIKWMLENDKIVPVILRSDSQYVLGIASRNYNPTKNQDLTSLLIQCYSAASAKGEWVKGHAGNAWNERCDQLAKAQKELLKNGK